LKEEEEKSAKRVIARKGKEENGRNRAYGCLLEERWQVTSLPFSAGIRR